MDEIVEKLKRLLKQRIDADSDLHEADIDVNTSLFEEGLSLDSITIIDFIADVEKEFDIRFPTEELRPDRFQSIAVVAELVLGKLSFTERQEIHHDQVPTELS